MSSDGEHHLPSTLARAEQERGRLGRMSTVFEYLDRRIDRRKQEARVMATQLDRIRAAMAAQQKRTEELSAEVGQLRGQLTETTGELDKYRKAVGPDPNALEALAEEAEAIAGTDVAGSGSPATPQPPG